jgi:hypothetical protein
LLLIDSGNLNRYLGVLLFWPPAKKPINKGHVCAKRKARFDNN